MIEVPPRYPILWVEARAILETKERAMLGICSYSKQVFCIISDKDVLFLSIVRNIIIDDAECEEAEGCLCFACPLNKTTKQSFLRRHGKERGAIAKNIDFERRAPIAANKSEEVKQMYAELIARHPDGGILIAEKRKRGKP